MTGVQTCALPILPEKLPKEKINFIYASEADILNVALFGMTAKEWREENPKLKGNIKGKVSVKLGLLVLYNRIIEVNIYISIRLKTKPHIAVAHINDNAN